MKRETIEKMKLFNKNPENYSIMLSEDYKKFNSLFKNMVSGEGVIGTISYLVLWEKSKIEEWNNDYAVKEFLNNIILIGSDGGDTAYGRNMQGKFIEVPFIGMDDEEVKIVANSFDEFIDYLWSKE